MPTSTSSRLRRTQGNKTVSMYPDHCNYPTGFCLYPRSPKRVCRKTSQPPQLARSVALETLFDDILTSPTARQDTLTVYSPRSARASSRVRKSPLGSQTWFSFFNRRYGAPAALPITALFFFESETARLMLVRHRWSQDFRSSLFSWLSRENAASDYKCGHGHKKHRKLNLLHRGVSIAPTPLR
jgi:hypothetical protein